jgi:hypothetical protein
MLLPIRTFSKSAPVIVAGYGCTLWPTARRLKQCEIYAPVDLKSLALYERGTWLGLTGRDVTFWPIDVLSSHVFTLVTQGLIPDCPFSALRWAWGHPAADELGVEPAEIETLYRAPTQAERAKAAA